MLFAEIRRLFGVRYNAASEPIKETESARFITCVFCFSIWLGLAVAVAYYFYPVCTYWVCLPFALSAGAIALDRWVNG